MRTRLEEYAFPTTVVPWRDRENSDPIADMRSWIEGFDDPIVMMNSRTAKAMLESKGMRRHFEVPDDTPFVPMLESVEEAVGAGIYINDRGVMLDSATGPREAVMDLRDNLVFVVERNVKVAHV